MYNCKAITILALPVQFKIPSQYMLYLTVTYIFNHHKYHVDIPTKIKSLETKQKKYLFVFCYEDYVQSTLRFQAAAISL